MRAALLELLKHMTTFQVEKMFKVTATDEYLKIQGAGEGNTTFFEATTNEPVEGIRGTFGINNPQRLRGLFELPTYKTDNASVETKIREFNNISTVEAFNFTAENGTKATYRCSSPELCPKQAVIGNVPYEVTLNLSQLAEFQAFARLYGDVEQVVVKSINGNLVFSLGNETAVTDSADIVVMKDIDFKANGMALSLKKLLEFMKIASSEHTEIKISSRGVVGFEVKTPLATYRYYLRTDVVKK